MNVDSFVAKKWPWKISTILMVEKIEKKNTQKSYIKCLFDLAAYWYTVSYLDVIFLYVPFGTVITTHQTLCRYYNKSSCGTESYSFHRFFREILRIKIVYFSSFYIFNKYTTISPHLMRNGLKSHPLCQHKQQENSLKQLWSNHGQHTYREWAEKKTIFWNINAAPQSVFTSFR